VTAVPARVSVVVPVYNVAAYLETCLNSLARQTMGDLEVVMVDDGSTDESADIAERFAASDARFRLVRQANAGLSAARNTGGEHARGEFIAFVDSDDVVPRHAYELLLGALDRTGSDFASGNVRRLTSSGTIPVGFLARAFERTRLRTHITRFPLLLADRTAWNKLFRRSFWNEHGLRFPEGVFYEDTPVTLPAHYLANSVDVIDQTVYLWRMREGGDPSITQRRTETKTLRDRISAVDHVSRFLAERGLRVSKALYDRTVLGQDLRFFLEVLPTANDEYRRLFLDLVNDFIDRAHPWVLEQRLAIERLKWQLVRRRALPELLEVLRFEEEELAETPPLRRGRRWYGDYPYRTDEHLKIPSRVYRLGEELAPVFMLNDVRWGGDALRLEGYAYIDLLGAPEAGSQQVELVARSTGWPPRRLRLETKRVHRPDVTASTAQELVGLDWAGFVATLDGSQLRRGDRWARGSWEIGVVIRAGGIVRRSWYPKPAPLHPAPRVNVSVDGDAHLRAGPTPSGAFVVRVAGRRACVRSQSLEDGVLELHGDPGPLAGDELTLRFTRAGAAALDYPVHVDRARARPTFLARVPLADLSGGAEDESPYLEQVPERLGWHVSLVGGGTRQPLASPEGGPETTWSVNGRQLAVRRTRAGELTVDETSLRPVITAAEWSPAGALLVQGSFGAPTGDYDLVLRAASRAQTYTVPLRRELESGCFSAELTPAAVASPAGARPLAQGVWQFLVGPRGASDETTVNALLDDKLLGELPLAAEIGHKRFQLGVLGDDSPVLAVDRDLDEGERGGYTQRRLRTSFYSAERRREVRAAVLYDCFGGREYSDSPRAIHEELVRRDAPFEHLWVVRDGGFEVPPTAVPVREQSRDYYEAFAQARYVVANDHWPRWFIRRPDQTCLQTWHGAPLKLHGHDLADRPRALGEYRRVLWQRPENWQFVVSPSPFATPILRRAFPIGGEVIETGLPRTDTLLRPDRAARAEAVKRRLGLAGQRVVLYAPSHRDHLGYRGGYWLAQFEVVPTFAAELGYRHAYRPGPLLDLGAVRSALPDDDVLLFRRHPCVVAPPLAGANGLLRDVSDFPDATDLLLVADVLVTDYSAAIFDFAVTGRPIILFTPDLDEYRDEIRGFNLDLEAEAPGPLLRTTSDVIEALREAEALGGEYRPRYNAFVDAYCSLADGQASSRVVDRVFR
jgi:CDP-glycerol glycerophosphotransferase